MYTLPKKYLSYSAASLWWKDKEEYRSRYYLNKPASMSKELVFGKRIAEMIETGDERVNFVPRLPKMEFEFNEEIDTGLVINGRLDSFDPETLRFYEYKTGKRKPDGAPAWTKVLVYKHLQLDVYGMFIKRKFGLLPKECRLIWLESEVRAPNGRYSMGDEMHLTGYSEWFKRKITLADVKSITALLVDTAREISSDYKNFKK